MQNFLGATDSAVPCAMLLNLGEKFKASFREQNNNTPANHQSSVSNRSNNSTTQQGRQFSSSSLGLRFIFFDGEEAFVEWSASDSLYGSRHLANTWAKQRAPSHCSTSAQTNELDRIELFILLDLIGANDSSFVLYDSANKKHWQELRRLEAAHVSTNQLLNSRGPPRQVAFRNSYLPLSYVEDDHVPFMRHNVPILLLLSSPFPKVWHTTADNYDAIDFGRTRRILSVLEQFISGYEARQTSSSSQQHQSDQTERAKRNRHLQRRRRLAD